MIQIKNVALAAALAGALGSSANLTAQFIDVPEIAPGIFATTGLTVGSFCSDVGGSPAFYQTPRYSFQCYDGSQSLDPAATHMAVSDLPLTTPVTLRESTVGNEVLGQLNINLSGVPTEVGELSYFVFVSPGKDFDADPDTRFARIALSQETVNVPAQANTASRKQITGQTTPGLVDPATFTADLNAEGAGGRDEGFCGVCREFAVTDSFNDRVDGTSDAGEIVSMTNLYATQVPVPGPLALIAVGLLGLAAAQRRLRD
mgnify:CR=1 FL=1